jgi:redox-sensitive bicupin YhaK (pirin superfamily)
MENASITIRPQGDRGVAEFGWLSSRHSFSFGSYYDPDHMGFRALRVINDDLVQPGQGFGMHPHENMEILSFIVDGKLEHRDSLNNGWVIGAGEVQRMTAGTGILHSEFNPSAEDAVRFLQVWIEPERRGLEPGYEQRYFDFAPRRDSLLLVASRDGRDGSLVVHQDIAVQRGFLSDGGSATVKLDADRHAWIQVVEGEVEVEGGRLVQGDGAAVGNSEGFTITGAAAHSDVIVFDLK